MTLPPPPLPIPKKIKLDLFILVFLNKIKEDLEKIMNFRQNFEEDNSGHLADSLMLSQAQQQQQHHSFETPPQQSNSPPDENENGPKSGTGKNNLVN